MYKTVANLRDSVKGMLQGLNLNAVTNINTAFERAARILSTKIDLPSVQGRKNVTLYDGVIRYTAPTDIFGTTLYDLQPQQERRITDYVYKQLISDFGRTNAYLPNGTAITFEYVNGTGYMDIKSVYPVPKMVLDPMTDTTGWTAHAAGNSLAQDKTTFFSFPASLRFNVNATAANAYIDKTLSSSLDLTDYDGVGVVFLALRLPLNSVSHISSIYMALGNDSSLSGYVDKTVTTAFLGAFQEEEWFLVSFDLATATKVGTFDVSKVKYLYVKINTDSTAIGNVNVGGFWVSLPSPATLIYGTAALFKHGTSAPSQSIFDNSDTINLPDGAYVIYEHQCAIEVATQQGGSFASSLVQKYDQELNGVRGYRGLLIQPGLLDIYRAENPSQKVPTQQSWYD